MYKYLVSFTAFVLLFVNSSMTMAKEGSNAWQSLFPGVPSITQSEIDAKKDELVFVDVRAKHLFDKKHKEGISHISFSSRMFMISMEGLVEKNAGKTVVVYCDSNNCIKSYRAVEKCVKAKLNNVVIFDRNEEMAKLKQDSVYTQLNLNQF